MRNSIRRLTALFVFFASAICFAQQLPHDDEVRIAEGFRLARQIEDKIWPGWSKAPFGVLLVTEDGEFLISHPLKKGVVPEGFVSAGHSDRLNADVFVRPRKFPLSFQATFPAVGDGIPVIVIGQPQHTESKTSTPWVITLMHDHFHQLQYSQPGYQEGVARLDLAKGDTSGMWMINFPFPYEKKETADKFADLKALLLAALDERNSKDFKQKATAYISARRAFLDSLSQDDRRYFEFQVWQEGLARYTQIRAAEAAAEYSPTPEFKALSDYEPFVDYAKRAPVDTKKELGQADIKQWQRVVFYSYGACEGMLLDRLNPGWQERYFKDRFATDAYFPSH